MTEIADMDRLIGRYLRASARAQKDHQWVGPFLARFDGNSASPFLSYAIPEDGAVPSAADVEALIAAFATRQRIPRLEYVPAAAPAVEVSLLAAGFTVEARYPVMTCSAVTPHQAAGISITLVQSDAEMEDAAKTAALAYGDDGVTAASFKAMVEAGALLALARRDGEAVGTGLATAMQESVVEIAGIGVPEAFRRHGIAAAMTAHLTAEAFARGARLAWLTPGHDAAERIYARAGFVRRSEQLHISKTV